ncbi:uncharacterized protein [Desmodus rotundus]|uniref:uncharacterized protein isoform X2 n=1 Tax=Desmodus rotundus TaxID=9430 RepID=UPI0039E5F60C
MGSAALPPSKRGRCIRPLTRASAALRYPTERSELDFREELADGFTCAMNRYKREERQGRDTVQCLSEISHDDIVQELVHESHYSICTFKGFQSHGTWVTLKTTLSTCTLLSWKDIHRLNFNSWIHIPKWKVCSMSVPTELL